MSKVQAYVYDITQGMASAMSMALVGKQIDYVPHTGIIVFGTEYFFGGGPCTGTPGQTVGCPVYKTLELGETSKTKAELDQYISSVLEKEHNEEKYSLLHHNCNHYADDVAKFLLGDEKGLPSEIVNIAAEALSSPQGQQMKVMIENMEKGMRQGAGGGSGLNPFASATGASPAMPVNNMGGGYSAPAVATAPAAAPAAAPAVNEDLAAALVDIAANDKEVQRACLTTLIKITENIIKDPVEAKFRKIKTSNAAFSKKVVACNGGVETMFACGWMPDVDPEGEDVWLLGDDHARSQEGPVNTLKASLLKLGPAPGAAPAPKAVASQPRFGTDAPPPGQGYGASPAPAAGMPGGLPGMGGMPGMGGGMGGMPPNMQQMMQNPQMMQQAQQMMQNPAMMQQAQQMMQSNPQMAAQMQQMMQDPAAMAQMQNMMGGRGGGGF